jgi:hypothetical protein
LVQVGAWLMHLFMVQVGAWLMHLFMVQVGAWLMHLFMVRVDYKSMHGSGYWYGLFGAILLVQVYSNISHNDSVTVVPSFYLYVRAVGWGNNRWL